MVVSALAQPEEKKKNKKEGKRKVDTGNIPGRVTQSKVVDPAVTPGERERFYFEQLI
jgi:hypothetical protein